MVKKKILFLSGIDFKERSIQVIRKTPEAFARHGWDVTYIVARDNSKTGNYFYEPIINPDNINVIRFNYPLTKLYNRVKLGSIKAILLRFRYILCAILLTYQGNRCLKQGDFSIVYGYESLGVIAAYLLKTLGKLHGIKRVSRFQGTFFVTMFLEQKSYFKLLLNLEKITALKIPSDLCIMTNDGTKGLQTLEKLKSKNLQNVFFWVNGVDISNADKNQIEKLKKGLKIIDDEVVILSISRLEKIKRVDSSIKIISKLKHQHKVNNLKLLIIGDGSEAKYLKHLAKKLKVEDETIFTNSVSHQEIYNYLAISKIFVSCYQSSNVGNPLLEAIRMHKIIFTLDNGDTSSWIQHFENGFIYPENSDFCTSMSIDIHHLLGDESLQKRIEENIRITEASRLWTWEERMNKEVEEIDRLTTTS